MLKIYPLIEGQGEVDAVPNLISRILHQLNCFNVFVGEVQKANGKGAFTREGGIERFVERAQMRPDCGAILILLDADDECPLERALDFASRLQAQGYSCPIAIALADRDFENWFLASLETLRGKPFSDGRAGLGADAPVPQHCEGVKGAGAYLSRYFPKGISYKKSLDQIMFTRLMNLDLTCSRSRSFAHFFGSVQWLVQAIQGKQHALFPDVNGLQARLDIPKIALAPTSKPKRKRRA